MQTSGFKRTRFLEVLAFEEQLGAQALIHVSAALYGCAVRDAGESFGGGDHVLVGGRGEAGQGHGWRPWVPGRTLAPVAP